MSNSEMDQAVKDWIARLRNSNSVQCRIEKPETEPVYSLEKLPYEAKARIKTHCPKFFTEDGTKFKLIIGLHFPSEITFMIAACAENNCVWKLDRKKRQKLGSYDLPFGYLLVFF